jgi:hypothetical protein
VAEAQRSGTVTQPNFHIKHATVVTPPDGCLDDVAERLVQAVYARFGVQPAIVAGDSALIGIPTRHVIALGCLADNPFVATLYHHWQTLVDRWYPGTGGWVLQFIRSPQRQGDHVLLLGGSDPQGVAAVTARFIEQFEASADGLIGWQLQVQLGRDHEPLPADRMDCLGTSASPILTPESDLPTTPYACGFVGGSARDHLLRLGMYGPHADNFHLSRSSQFGLRYLYTGRIEDAQDYRTTLLEEARSGALQRLYHYKSIRMFQLWAVLGDCPVFAEEERTRITAAIRCYLLEESGVASRNTIQAASGGTEIFSRHIACDALNLWVGADWLRRTTGERRWLDERAVADAYFEAQVGTDVPLTGLTEGYASYLEVYLEWMLLCHPERIADDPHIRLWAERVIGLCTNTGQLVMGPQTDASRYPYNLLRKLACLLADGRYLSVADLRERQVAKGMDRALQFGAGQAWATDVQATEPGESVGLTVYPMNERLRQWQAPGIAPGKGFDRAVARSGWAEDDDYLMLIGVRSGGKSLPNVGTLAAYERFGQRLITSDLVPLYPRSASPWRHSRVTVSIGGLGAGMNEGAEVLAQKAVAGGQLFSFVVNSAGHHRWIRLLYWKPSAYVLVVDRILLPHGQADEASGGCTLGVNWRCAGQLLGIDHGLATLGFIDPDVEGRFHVEVSGGLQLRAETDSYPALGAPEDTPPMAELMLHGLLESPKGAAEVEVATLLHAVAATDGPGYRLTPADGGWIVSGVDESYRFSRGAEDGDMEIAVCAAAVSPVSTPDSSRDSPPGETISAATDRSAPGELSARWSHHLPDSISAWTQRTDGAAIAAGTAAGEVVVLDATGVAQWRSRRAAAITAIVFCEQDLLVGTRAGEVCRFGPTGGQLWCYTCQFRPERAFWPWWFLSTPVVGALAAGRDPISGQQVVAVGTGSTSLNFLEAETGRLIDDVVSPYGLPDQIQAHVPHHTGEMVFLVGHSWLTCGSSVRAWTPSHPARESNTYCESVAPMGRSTGGWDSCGIVDFWVGSLAHDMPQRMIVLRHGAVNQLTMYDEASGEPLWDVGIGGAPVALGVVSGGESQAAARCYVADQFGCLVVFDLWGTRLAATRVAPSLLGMTTTPAGDLLLWNAEQLLLVRAGQVTDRYHLEGEPLGWLANPEHPGLLCVQQGQLVLQRLRDLS